jgi:hypothetical protein
MANNAEIKQDKQEAINPMLCQGHRAWGRLELDHLSLPSC